MPYNERLVYLDMPTNINCLFINFPIFFMISVLCTAFEFVCVSEVLKKIKNFGCICYSNCKDHLDHKDHFLVTIWGFSELYRYFKKILYNEYFFKAFGAI
jgi:hypothetical protein